MKKIIASAASALILFGFTACETTSQTKISSQQDKIDDDKDAENVSDASKTDGPRTLVVYYSATGSTKKVATVIAEATNGILFELEPVDAYSHEDLDWTADGSRVNLEHNDESLRSIKLVSTTVENWSEYDSVFIGYPIWWGIAAWPLNEFITSNDFSGKTVIPFCTSASSGVGESDELLSQMAGTGHWLDGYRFRSNASNDEILEWISTLND